MLVIKRTKIVVLWILSIMLVLLTVKNTAYVRARFLWLTADVSVILLLSFAATGGFISGILVALRLGNKALKGEAQGNQNVVSTEKQAQLVEWKATVGVFKAKLSYVKADG